MALVSSKLQGEDLQKVLSHLLDALKYYDPQELSDVLASAINKRCDGNNIERFILDLVCDTYKISYRLLIHGKSKQRFTYPREVAYCLLHLSLGLSVRDIASRIFRFKNHNGVHSAIKKYKQLNMDLNIDKEFKNSIDQLRDKILAKMNNNDKN